MKKVKLLIVEDEILVAKGIKIQLEDIGYEVCQIVSKKDETMRAMKIHSPDLILMDIDLGGPINGIDLAIAIKNSYNVPVIYLTDIRDKDTFDRAKETGPAIYLNKPFNEYELGQHIDLAIHNAYNKTKQKVDNNEAFVMKDILWIKQGTSFNKVAIEDVLWIKASGAYCEVVTSSKTYTLSKNMREVNDFIDHADFVKVHKSYTVNTSNIDSMRGSMIIVNNYEIPIGKTYLAEFKEKLKIL